MEAYFKYQYSILIYEVLLIYVEARVPSLM